MIPAGLEIFVAREPVNMRLSLDRLMGLASSVIGRSPRTRALFVFFGMRWETLNILFCDDSGVCIFHKRLDRRRFRIPDFGGDADRATISEVELETLLEGLSLDTGQARRRGSRYPHTSRGRTCKDEAPEADRPAPCGGPREPPGGDLRAA